MNMPYVMLMPLKGYKDNNACTIIRQEANLTVTGMPKVGSLYCGIKTMHKEEIK